MKLTGVRLFDGRTFTNGTGVSVHGDRIDRVWSGDEHTAPRALVMPGLIDAHVHLHQIAAFLGELELDGVESAEELLDRLNPVEEGRWVLGKHLDHRRWRPHASVLKSLLDHSFPGVPVRLLFSDGHSAIFNERGLQESRPWHESGPWNDVHFEAHPGGDLTGLAVDGNLELSRVPPPAAGLPGAGRDRLEAAAAECAKHGITGVHDLLVTVPEYLQLLDAGPDGLRVCAYVTFREFDEVVRLRKDRGSEVETDRIRLMGIKCFADGSLGSNGALLSRPYLASPDNRGFEAMSPGDIGELARACLEEGLQLAVHALGDGGVANVLDAFEESLGAHGKHTDHRFRIEHAQVMQEEDIARCRELSVILSMQPYHFTDDARWLPERLPPELCRRVSLWRRLVDEGIPVCFGSDAPFTNLSAVDGIRSAVHRLETVDPQARRFFADEALTLEQALASYSSGAAYAVFEEGRLGRIAPGRPADLTVFDPGLERVLLTMVSGQVTWMDDEAREWLD